MRQRDSLLYLWLVIGAVVSAALIATLLLQLGWEPNIYFMLAVVAGSALSDLLIAISNEAFSPTRVTIGPGEKSRQDAELDETAVVRSGFDNSVEGLVTVRGESWKARRVEELASNLQSGQEVSVVGRDGLTLLMRERAA